MNVQKTNSARLYFLDILRIAAACAVILLHTVSGMRALVDMNQYPAQLNVFIIVTDFTAWCVPVFIIISGYLFLNPSRTFSYGKIISKYCRRILLSLIIFGIPYACIELIVQEQSFNAGMLVRAFVMVCRGESWAHMWYLYLILLLYMITPPLKWVLYRVPDWFVYIFLALIIVFGSIMPFVKKWLGMESIPALPDEAIYFFYYICGYLFAKHAGEKAEKERTKPAKGVIPLTFGIVLTLICMLSIRLTIPDSVQLPYNYPLTVLLSLLIFCAASYIRGLNEKAAEAVTALSSLCFTVYLIHPVFINAAYKFFNLSLLDYPLGLSIPVFFLVFLILSLPTAWLIRKIPFMKKYVL
jgi:surface polysaccharide O-acyltransferase-like enzyme